MWYRLFCNARSPIGMDLISVVAWCLTAMTLPFSSAGRDIHVEWSKELAQQNGVRYVVYRLLRSAADATVVDAPLA